MLSGTDKRFVGKAEAVIKAIDDSQRDFNAVFKGIYSDDPVISMRAADVSEKVAGQNPELLQPLKREILHSLHLYKQKEVRWHMAQMITYLNLEPKELGPVFHHLMTWLHFDDSKIVKANSLEALVQLSLKHNFQVKEVKLLIQKRINRDEGAVKARAQRLESLFPQGQEEED